MAKRSKATQQAIDALFYAELAERGLQEDDPMYSMEIMHIRAQCEGFFED